MIAPEPTSRRPQFRTKIRWWWFIPIALLLIPLGLSWFFTASLSDHPADQPTRSSTPIVPMADADLPLVDWPATRLDGDKAKQILLESARRSAAKVEQVEYYTATFHRQERVNGVLGPEIISDLKIRNHPFAIYLKYQTVRPGKEVVYAVGHHDDKVIAHNGDWTRRLIPRLAVDPTSALALADSRHPVTDAGLLNLTRKLLKFRQLDMGDEAATTVLDRTTEPDGRVVLRSFHSHAKPNDGRPFCQVEILYDLDTQIPFQIKSYDWPEPGHTGNLDLAERYTYENLKLDAPLTAIDFDPANPAYAFMRF